MAEDNGYGIDLLLRERVVFCHFIELRYIKVQVKGLKIIFKVVKAEAIHRCPSL